MTAHLKMLNWGDDLRLPTFTDPAEFSSIVQQLEEYRSPSIPFQSKHLHSLKRNVWFALKRPDDRSRSGLLCVWPLKKSIIFVLGNRVALLRLRVDSQLLADSVGITLFAATLSPSSRRLWIEDTLVWKGRNLASDTFSQRFAIAKQWVDNYVIQDPRLVSGIEVELGKWAALSTVSADGSWDFIADDSRARIYWKGESSKSMRPEPIKAHGSPKDVLKEVPKDVPKEALKEALKEVPTLIIQDVTPRVLVANAKRETGPDQWSLSSSDGVSLGRALVRKMSISSAMNQSGMNACVEVSWNVEFMKWEILSVHSGPASSSSFFTSSK